MSEMISNSKFERHVKSIVAPEGFTAMRITEEVYTGLIQQIHILKSDTIEIKFDQTGGGHTSFLHQGKWLCFDRRGIEDSFYHLPLWDGDDVPDANAIVAEQLERIENYKKEFDVVLEVPGIPVFITPKRLAELKKQLGNNKSVSFMPSGFGIGYVVAPRKTDRRDKRATQATEEFFGVSPLFISTFDAD